ncbi:SDR family oxidoreductase [Thalassobacillus hwangdonensis]|uniref:SDR family oxidoreductase n=1 Tax=Thalassobacillus hwangdonensis TaxID=546108 RepID=A0ABW3L029_9BACI
MKVLILGGTVFVGRHIVEQALERGHEVTLFNRGKTNNDLFPEVEKLIGDRDDKLKSLEGRQWDVVIDTTGYVPRIVEQSAKLLKDHVKKYVFVSTISVYKDYKEKYLSEDYPKGEWDATTEEVTGGTYGPMKFECERRLQEILSPGQLTVVRPGLIVGPNDPTDRFSYWVDRYNRGGEILVPDLQDQPIQVIDVRDLASWMIALAESGETGTYNATGYDESPSWNDFLESLKKASSSNVTEVKVDPEKLLKTDVRPFVDIPLWIPKSEQSPHGYFLVDNQSARKKGLKFRPLLETIEDTKAWLEETGREMTKAGLDADQERELLRTLR